MIALGYEDELGQAGYTVVGPAPSVARAMACLDSEDIDAALLDISLDDHDSFPVADRLVQASIPFLFVSGMSAEVLPDRLKGRKVLSKPVEARLLREAVREMTEGRR